MPVSRLGGLCTLHQAGNTAERFKHQREGIAGAHVGKFTAIQATLFCQLIEHFMPAGPPLGPGDSEAK